MFQIKQVLKDEEEEEEEEERKKKKRRRVYSIASELNLSISQSVVR